MKNKLTIVGPEPEKQTGRREKYSLNIEALLLMAKYNNIFRNHLLNDRKKAIENCGITFSENEKILLTGVSAKQLSHLIKTFRVPGITKRSLPTWKKAAAILLLLSSTNFIGVDSTNSAQAARPIIKTEYRSGIPVSATLLQEKRTVEGRVTEEYSEEPLPGVNVLIKGTTTGTVTDIDGKFSIDVSTPDDILVFTYVGYISQEFPVENMTDIDIVLVQDLADLEEIQVISYGITPGRRVLNKITFRSARYKWKSNREVRKQERKQED